MTAVWKHLAMLLLASGLGGATSMAADPASDSPAFTPGNLFVAHRRADLTDSVFEFALARDGSFRGVVREITDPLPGYKGSTGWGPSGMAIGGPGVDLYVASILRGTISQFSQRDGSHLRTVEVIAPPPVTDLPSGLHGVAWGPNGNLFVARCSTDEARLGPDAVLELDRKSLKIVRRIRQAEPTTVRCYGGIAFGPGDLLYVTGINSGNIVALDLATVRGDGIVTAPTVRDIAMMQDGEDPVAALAALTFGPDGTLYVSIGQGGKLEAPRIGVVAPDASTQTRAIPVGQPTGIRFGANGHVFVGDRATRAVLEIDPKSGERVRKITNGRSDDGALDPRFVIFHPMPFQ